MSDAKITLTYLNVRQSITILLAKLILTDVILAFIVIFFYFTLIEGQQYFSFIAGNPWIFLIGFIILGIIKIGLSVYVVLEWLNEYYEITPEVIMHKKGFIFRKTEKYNLDKVRRVSIQSTFLGEIFNYATVSLYDIRLNKYLDLYLIHNPERYVKILRMLCPDLEVKTDKIRLPFMPDREPSNELKEDSV